MYLYYYRRPVWRWCGTSEWGTERAKSCHLCWGIHLHSSSRAWDPHPCRHLHTANTSLYLVTYLKVGVRSIFRSILGLFGYPVVWEEQTFSMEYVSVTYNFPTPKCRFVCRVGSDWSPCYTPQLLSPCMTTNITSDEIQKLSHLTDTLKQMTHQTSDTEWRLSALRSQQWHID